MDAEHGFMDWEPDESRQPQGLAGYDLEAARGGDLIATMERWIADLLSAGWQRHDAADPAAWRAPNGDLYPGPGPAWQAMRGA